MPIPPLVPALCAAPTTRTARPRLRHAAALALAAGLGTAVVAQELPPLVAGLSVQNDVYGNLISGDEGYGYLRCTADPSAANAWYRPIVCATISDESYFSSGGLAAMRPTVVELGTVAAGFADFEAGAYLGSTWEIGATPAATNAALAAMLLTDGEPNGAAVAANAMPLVHATPEIVSPYTLAALHGWETDDGTDALNLDSIRQQAVWERVAPTIGMTQQAFFESSHYSKMVPFELEIGVTLLGVRGPDVPPGPATPPPTLGGYPYAPPILTKSQQVKIRFSGTGGTMLGLMFLPGWSAPILPVHAVHDGTTLSLPAVGYRPDMQVLLASDSQPQRYELTVRWAGYGKVAFQVPAGISGFHTVTHYRFREPGPAGPVFGAWQPVPWNGRPRLDVL